MSTTRLPKDVRVLNIFLLEMILSTTRLVQCQQFNRLEYLYTICSFRIKWSIDVVDTWRVGIFTNSHLRKELSTEYSFSYMDHYLDIRKILVCLSQVHPLALHILNPGEVRNPFVSTRTSGVSQISGSESGREKLSH